MKNILMISVLSILLSACGGGGQPSADGAVPAPREMAFDGLSIEDAMVLVSDIQVRHEREADAETTIFEIATNFLRGERARIVDEQPQTILYRYDVVGTDGQQGSRISLAIMPDKDDYYRATWAIIQALIDKPGERITCGEATTILNSRQRANYAQFEDAVDFICDNNGGGRLKLK
jgi:hypothetical protein